jgi:hypothetical protein
MVTSGPRPRASIRRIKLPTAIIDKFELGPNTDDKDESIDTVLSEMESEDDEMIGLKRKKNSEATKPSTMAKSSAVTQSSAAIKSSIGMDE